MRTGVVASSALGDDWTARAHLAEPTAQRCPEREPGDNSTHHLAPTQAREAVMKCTYCGKTEKQLREEG